MNRSIQNAANAVTPFVAPEKQQKPTDWHLKTEIEQVKSNIQSKLLSLASYSDSDETPQPPVVNTHFIKEALTRVLFKASNQRYMIMSQNGRHLNEHTGASIEDHLSLEFGCTLIDPASMERYLKACEIPKGAKNEAREIPFKCLRLFVENKRQFSEFAVKVTVFDDRPNIKVVDGTANITEPLKLAKEPASVNMDIVNIYREHFPQVDEVLDQIIDTMITPNIKKSTLWINAVSDAGKNALVHWLWSAGLMDKQMLDLSMEQMRNSVSGSSLNIDPKDMARSACLVMDEVKYIDDAFKNFEGNVTLRKAYGSPTVVRVPMKIMLSKDPIAGLVDETGIDTQFANRVNMIVIDKSLAVNEQWSRYNQAEQDRAMVGYFIKRVNSRIDEYRSMNEFDAIGLASRRVEEFYKRNKITNRYKTIESMFDELGGDLRSWLMEQATTFIYFGQMNNSDFVVDKKNVYVKNVAKVFKEWLKSRGDYKESTGKTMKRNKDAIIKSASIDGDGYKNRRVDQSQFKAIRIR